MTETFDDLAPALFDDLNEIAGALAAFQAEVPVIPKKQTAQIQTAQGRNYSYTYADLATIAPVVMPLLAKHGLAFTALPQPSQGDRGPVLVGMLVHKSGQRLTGQLPISGRTPQEIGSSLTYGRRYLLGCLTGVVTDDDDDGQLAEKAARRPRKAAPSPEPDPAEPVPVAPPIQRRTPVRPATEGATAEMVAARAAMFAGMAEVLGGGDENRAERVALTRAIVGRPIESSKDLNRAEISKVLTFLDDAKAGRVGWQFNPLDETVEILAEPEPWP